MTSDEGPQEIPSLEEAAKGKIRRQEPGQSTPRPPKVADARARDRARWDAQQLEAQQQRAMAEAKSKRKRKMRGAVAIVGVASVVGGGYLAYRALRAPDRVSAQCVMYDGGVQRIVNDDFCDDNGRGHTSGFIYMGGHSYRYHYGSKGKIGSAPMGGSTVRPKSAHITTSSGKTIQRGGFGSKSSGGGS